MVMTLSPDPRCFSTSIWAPDTSRIALMLQPPRPITRLMAEEGTCTFLDLQEIGLQRNWLTIQNHSMFTNWLIVYTDHGHDAHRLTTSFQPSSFFCPFLGLAITGVDFTWRLWTEGETFSPFCLLTCNTWSDLSLKLYKPSVKQLAL